MLRSGAAAVFLAVGVASAQVRVDFRTVPLGTYQIAPAVDDIDGDGWVEPLLTWNDGAGKLIPQHESTLGLGALFAGGRFNRDVRLADLNGDGLLDVVSNTYGCVTGDAPPALLFFNNGNRTFTEQPAFRALGIRGRGESIVVADFDNDHDLDLFIPFYTYADPFCPNSPKNYLLSNDGSGRFTDVSEAAGVAMPDWPHYLRPEGAQAVDVNGDGHLDLYAASHLFINNGDMTFRDRRAEYGLPLAFDEGLKFFDWNEDGRLDLVLQHELSGPRLFEFDGVRFRERLEATNGSGRPFFSGVAPGYGPLEFVWSWGMNAGDLDGDGREDVLTNGDAWCDTAVLINRRHGFERLATGEITSLTGCATGWGGPTPVDINGDGHLDVIYARYTGLTYYANRAKGIARTLRIDVLGAGGRRNQYGRMVQVTSRDAPGRVITRVVDGGSGFMSQTPYTIQIPARQRSAYKVTAFFGPSPEGKAQTVSFVMHQGQHAEVQPDGVVRIRPQGPAAPVPPAPLPDDPGVYRPRESTFFFRSAPAPSPPNMVAFGVPGDWALAGDWNGDGGTTIGVYRPSNARFYLRDRNTAGEPDYVFRYEIAGLPVKGIPLVGDWRGAGRDTVGLYVPEESRFYLLGVLGAGAHADIVDFGMLDALPLVGDWDGNGTTTVGFYQPAQARFVLRNCNVPGPADLDFRFGMPGDLPIRGDFDGDGIDTVGVYRAAEGRFLLRNRNAAGPPDLTVYLGGDGDVPLMGRWAVP